MSRKADIADQRFGSLVALHEEGRDNFNRLKWRCRCDCGATIIAASNNLRTGSVKSCGCQRWQPRRLDLTGHRYGRLTVLSVALTERGRVWWHCECDCGNRATVLAMRLRRGKTMSCGCLQDEMRRKAGKPMGPGRWMKTIRGAQGECLKCGSSDSLHAHHIFPAGRYPHLALDLSNGAALCAECHKAFHRRYGKECANVDDLCGWLGLDEASTEAIRSFVGWRSKGGVEDLKKARHFLDMLIERESG